MKAKIPYINVDIPIWIVFRALGVISVRGILEYICYDLQDSQIMKVHSHCWEKVKVTTEKQEWLNGGVHSHGVI